jgi:predicted transcriptional regulator
MKISRRDKLKIYGDLLSILNRESKTEKIALTKVQRLVNVPFDRLKIYISDLKELGLIQDETSLRLSKKGKQYVREYEQVLDFMKRMGITYQQQKPIIQQRLHSIKK